MKRREKKEFMFLIGTVNLLGFCRFEIYTCIFLLAAYTLLYHDPGKTFFIFYRYK